MNAAGAVNRLVVFGDVCGSGRLGMEAKKRMRVAMYEAFGEAFASVGVERGRIHQEDRGDGILAALDPGVPPALMVGRWTDTLYENLREHNAGGTGEQLRMRVGMNAGPVLNDGNGLVGRAVDLACRLCDSAAAKQVMAAAPKAHLLLVVSDWLYANVVAEGGRYVEPDHYRSARVQSKETDEIAWFHIPRLPEPPVVREDPQPAGGNGAVSPTAGQGTDGGSQGDVPPSGRPRNVFNVQGDSQYFQGNVIHGGFTGIRKDRERDRGGAPDQAPPRGGDGA